MKIDELSVRHFRNLSELVINPCEHVNIILGDNAQGKTNLLEAIWLCSGKKSFRGARESQMVQFSEPVFLLSLLFSDRERQQQITYAGGEKRKITLNRVDLKKLSELSGIFYCICFDPDDLSLVKAGPQNRRQFLDIAITQIQPVYGRYLDQYYDLLEQRNALLKEYGGRVNLPGMLEIWDTQLAKMGTAISILRQDYLQKLQKVSSEIYGGFTGRQEKFALSYQSSVYPEGTALSVYSEELISAYRDILNEHLEDDLRMRYTTVGIHRDDIYFSINGLNAQQYGSQGQQRSCAIALKLGEAEMIRSITGERPIILLDDVMSELDPGRQEYILNQVRGYQVFITCCDVSDTMQLSGGQIFRMEKGVLTKKQETESISSCICTSETM